MKGSGAAMRTSGWSRRLAGLVLAVSMASATAATFKPGDDVELPPGEGAVLVVVNSGLALESLWIEGDRGREKLMSFRAGTDLRLVTLPPGRYAWSKLRARMGGDSSGDAPINAATVDAFTVEAGVVNYGGDLDIATSLAGWWVYARTQNRLARALYLLEQSYPELRAKIPLKWQGATPDRFIERLDAARGSRDIAALTSDLDASVKSLLDEEVDPTLPAVVQELFPADSITHVELSAGGNRLLVSRARTGQASAQIIDVATRKAMTVYDDVVPITDAAWLDDTTLVLGSGSGSVARVEVFRVKPTVREPLAFERILVPDRARFVDVLQGSPAALLVEFHDRKNQRGLFRVDVHGKRIDAVQLRRERRLDKGIEDAASVMTDGRELRVAFVPENGAVRIKQRDARGAWAAGGLLPGGAVWKPLALTADAQGLYALTDHERAQTELVRVDLANGAIIETVRAVPGVDIEGANFDARRRLVSVFWHQQGLLEVEDLGAEAGGLRDRLRGLLPGKTIVPLQSAAGDQRTLAFVASETDPGSYVLYDAEGDRVETLVSSMPTFARVKPVPSLVLRAKARDGFEVESYLTLPATGGHRHPLVVMPHGGPQGVRDTRSFDPEVQLLAHYGYAVLRVNFRGSSGFGKAFREGGLHNWGRGIEDDILAALDGALAAQPLDTARVALRGTSYGGYSALMGLVRSPDRFRCGVAIAAVTDLPLLFVAGDGGQRVDDRKALGTLLGDPLRQLAELEDMSPAYRTRDLRQPILIVHERGDARVPIEHAMRLGLMLAADGRAPSFLPVDEVSHGHFSARGRLVVEAAGFALLNRCLVKR